MSKTPSELTVEEMQSRIDEIVAEFAALNISADSSDEDITKGEELAAEVRSLREEMSAREDRAARLSNLTDTFKADEPVDEEEEEEDDEEMSSEETVEASTEEASAPAEEAPAAEADNAEADNAEASTEEVEEEEPQPVAAAAATKTSPARRAAAHAPEVKMPKSQSVAVITAAADVPGFTTGGGLEDLDQVVEAMIARMRAMPQHNIPNTRHRYGVASIRKQGYGELVQGQHDDYGLIQKAGMESRLPGGSLTAAGGWCSPSETLYDLCTYESTDGLIDLPEVTVNRGGIRYTPGPDFSDFYNNVGAILTEAQVIADTTKTCLEVACPAFTDVRLDAVHTCIKAPILTNAAYPELVRRYIEGSLIATQHMVSKFLIDTMITAGGTPVAVPENETLLFNLDFLEWQATSMKYAYRLPVNSSIEVVAPVWIKPLIRAELARRTGVELQSVSDAQIMEWFTVRGLAPQFVYGLDDLTDYPAVQSVPATANIVMYPAGTWVKGTSDVINLDAVYDSASLVQNIYTALFAEEGVLAVQRCTGTNVIAVPVKVTGNTAAASLTEILGTATV